MTLSEKAKIVCAELYKWLVVSSVNPQETSMTIKAALLFVTPELFKIADTIGWQVPETTVKAAVTSFCVVVGSLLTMFAFMRKVYNTNIEDLSLKTDTTKTPNVPEI